MSDQVDTPHRSEWHPAGWGLPVFVLALFAVASGSVIYSVSEHRQTRELAASNQALSTTLSQVQSQMQAISEKLNAMSAPETHAPAAAYMTPLRPPAPVQRVRRKAAPHRL